MHIDAAFPSKYLKMADLNGRTFRLTIARIDVEDVGDGDRKPVMYFEKTDKGLALNRINADTISAAYGPETDHWIGRIIELYPDPNVYYGPKKVGGLRVRIPRVTTAPVIAPTHQSAPMNGGYPGVGAPPTGPLGGQYDDRNPPPSLDDDSIPF